MQGWIATLALVVALGTGAGCSDSTGPDTRPEEDFQALRIRPDAPPLETSDTSFYAKSGEDRELAIYFTDGGGGRGTIFCLLQVKAGSLLARPDGSLIAPGDSVLIRMRVPDPTRVLVELEPSSLRFNPAMPANLLLHYNEVDHDFNGDGMIDAADQAIEASLSIWRQETVGGVFEQLSSTVNLDLDGVGASLGGFTRYAISY
jgi:hypothetical protein